MSMRPNAGQQGNTGWFSRSNRKQNNGINGAVSVYDIIRSNPARTKSVSDNGYVGGFLRLAYNWL